MNTVRPFILKQAFANFNQTQEDSHIDKEALFSKPLYQCECSAK